MIRIGALLKGLEKMEIGRAIREARKAKGWTLEELAHQVGTDSGNLSRLERGRQGASQDLLIKILDALGMPLGSTIAAESMRSNIESADVQRSAVPVISWAQAGQWTGTDVMTAFTVGDVEEWVACPVPHGPRTFVLRVRGESMFSPYERRSFRDGDLIYVDPDRNPETGSMVVARIGIALEPSFRQLIAEGDHKFLKALNPAWPEPITLVNEDTTICGTVIFKGEYI